MEHSNSLYTRDIYSYFRENQKTQEKQVEQVEQEEQNDQLKQSQQNTPSIVNANVFTRQGLIDPPPLNIINQMNDYVPNTQFIQSQMTEVTEANNIPYTYNSNPMFEPNFPIIPLNTIQSNSRVDVRVINGKTYYAKLPTPIFVPLYYNDTNSLISYNDKTINHYRILRQSHYDPLFNIKVDDDIAFKFNYQWNPYTGERTFIDPYGSLYFHPAVLIHYFYTNRLIGLWHDVLVGNNVVGQYDHLIGIGENIPPELYLFRLPINDCYLVQGQDMSHPTMGPRLTHDEIITIDNLSKNSKVSDFYQSVFGMKCPSILHLKTLYENSISNKFTDFPNYAIQKVNINRLKNL
jgi:hypothetical protein